MRKILVAVMICLMTSVSYAQTQPAPSEAASGSFDLWKTLAIGVGVIGGIVVVDLLTGGTLTSAVIPTGVTPVAAGPVVYPPEVLEARAAGAVLGEMITPATSIRDTAARADMLWTAALAVGAVAGGYLINLVVSDSSK